MEDLTKAEERIMQVIWKLKKVFVKDIIDELDDDPKPPYNTISSIVRLLEKKGYVTYNAYGKTHQYLPAVSKAEYTRRTFGRFFRDHFNNSATSLMSFLVEDQKLTKSEIDELRNLIDKNS
ncbi:MAG: BlaI/MecI/CopY family transcriptional regulator [Mucilaginibacter polytrichastri]|nr:BlaI/MecI/CopY family transcriptional regulator [Mucilaginibacter polytrichastri]